MALRRHRACRAAGSRCATATDDRRRAGRAGRGGRRHRAHPRPAVRGRDAPRTASAGRCRQADVPRRDQPAGLRGLRRLRRREQLPVGAAGRHGVRVARPGSTRPAATSTSPASRATARPSPRSPSRRTPGRAGPSPRIGRRLDVRRAGDPGVGARSRGRGAGRPRSPSACPASAAPAWSRSARSWAPRPCSTAWSCGASTRPGCRRRPARSSATCGSAGATSRRRTTPTAPGCDCLLAFDLLVAASDGHRVAARADHASWCGSDRCHPDGRHGHPPDDALSGSRRR